MLADGGANFVVELSAEAQKVGAALSRLYHV